ncbi:MAG: hypothetical protein CMO80_03765 [Verrucomicrobiales bacterium]|nr:hypothetical protein [Verrucomicrobiales bacterium]
MKKHWYQLFVTVFLASGAFEAGAAYPPFKVGLNDFNFTISSQLSTTNAVKARVGYFSRRTSYNPKRELYRVVVPPNYKHTERFGLLVYMAPFDRPTIPQDWLGVLAKHRLLIVLPANAGDKRSSADRIRMALDARYHMPRMYNVDGSRVIISGHGGGARLASVMGVAYPDQFPNTITFMGLLFYKAVPIKGNRQFPPAYTPDPKMVALAKNNRFLFTSVPATGTHLETVLCYRRGFKAEGFHDAHYMELAGNPYLLPPGKTLDKVLSYFQSPGGP